MNLSPFTARRYMKSIFPKAEETLILDVLANADNNVQTASQQLLKMGYDKREQPVPQRSSASRKGTGTSQATEDDKKEELKTPTPKLKSPEEKKKSNGPCNNGRNNAVSNGTISFPLF